MKNEKAKFADKNVVRENMPIIMGVFVLPTLFINLTQHYHFSGGEVAGISGIAAAITIILWALVKKTGKLFAFHREKIFSILSLIFRLMKAYPKISIIVFSLLSGAIAGIAGIKYTLVTAMTVFCVLTFGLVGFYICRAVYKKTYTFISGIYWIILSEEHKYLAKRAITRWTRTKLIPFLKSLMLIVIAFFLVDMIKGPSSTELIVMFLASGYLIVYLVIVFWHFLFQRG